MGIKSIIALFLGLVIQLSQVQGCLTTGPTGSCGGDGRSMSCCDGLQSCPCASESNPDQKPIPLLPAAVDLKLLISKAPEAENPGALISPPAEIVVVTGSLVDSRSGFAGVPQSVAFCRFVI